MKTLLTSLSIRLALAFTVLVLVVMAGLAAYLLSALQGFALDQLHSSLVAQGQMLAPQLGDELGAGDYQHLRDYLASLDRASDVRVLIVDDQSNLVASSEEGLQPLVGSKVRNTGLAEALKGAVNSGRPIGSTNEVAYASVPILDSTGRVLGAVRLSYESDDIADMVSHLELLVVSAIVVVSIVAGLFGLVIAASLTQPLNVLVKATSSIAAGDLSARVPVHPPDELAVLAESFNHMAERLSVAERARRDLMSDVSHELHTLAGAMAMGMEALRRGALGSPEAGEKIVRGLSGHVTVLTRLADDLLETSRVEAGRFSVVLEELNLAELLEDVRLDFAREAQRRGISLSAAVTPEAELLTADGARLRQALGNLVDNAMRATPTGGSINLVARTKAGSTLITVSDTGAGVPLEQQSSLFDRSRQSPASSRHSGRLGIGLSIVDAIARAHGGRVTLASEPGNGTQVTIELPASPRLIASVDASPRAT